MTASVGIDPKRRGPRFAWIQPDSGPAVFFDLIMSETATNTSEVTDHPVEIGSDVSDNIRHEPESLTLEGIVSQSPTVGQNAPNSNFPGAGWQLVQTPLDIPKFTPPLSLSSVVAAGVSALGSLLFGTPPTIATTLAPTGPQDRIAQIHNILTTLERAGTLVSVVGTTKQYDSMAITSVTVTREELGSSTFRVEFRRVNIVATATVAAPTPLIKAAAPAKNAGPQTPKPMSPAEKQSIASQGLQAVVGLVSGGG